MGMLRSGGERRQGPISFGTGRLCNREEILLDHLGTTYVPIPSTVLRGGVFFSSNPTGAFDGPAASFFGEW